MPSDERVSQVLAAVAGLNARYRAALSGAVEQIREYLDRNRAPQGDAPPAGSRLGRFAAGRIDEARFAALFDASAGLTPERLAPIEQAEAVLQELLDRGDDLFACEVPAGGSLRRTVEDALAGIGRAFGAALMFQAVRTGAYRADKHDRLLSGFPFRSWNRSERQLGPALVVELDGSDLRAGDVPEFLDGAIKLVLLVRGPCTPAPLVRCITPGTLVLQTTTVDGLQPLAGFDGPGVAAVVPEGAARFVHDPGAGLLRSARLAIDHFPEDPPRHPLGGQSPWQQQEELALLADLGMRPLAGRAGIGAVSVASAQEQSIDSVAAWLLTQAGLEPVAGGTRQ